MRNPTAQYWATILVLIGIAAYFSAMTIRTIRSGVITARYGYRIHRNKNPRSFWLLVILTFGIYSGVPFLIAAYLAAVGFTGRTRFW